jgi:hypothetical protein
MENGNQAPAADAGGGAPAAPQAPPAAPAAPVTPAPADNQQAPNATEQADAGEWDDAVDELFPGIRTSNKGANKNEPKDPNATAETTQAPAEGTDGNDPSKPKGEGEAEGDGENEEESEQPDFSGRDARVAQREYQKQVESVKADVREKLYADVPKTLQDADGDPIRGIEDVMKLINPRTITAETPEGRTFTEEEAGMWLLSAQQQFNKNMENLDKRIDQIAEVNVDIGEQADVIKYKYGELLKVLPDPDNPKKLYRDTLWEDYQNTLKTDPNTNVILEAPVSLERFYERALAPYARMAQEAEQNNSSAPAAPAAPAPPAPDPNANRAKVRTDRSDIFGGTNPNEGQSEEDKEWGAAIGTVFPQLNKK